MNAVQRFLAKHVFSLTSYDRQVHQPISAESTAGVHVDDSVAVSLSAVWACVRLIAETVATLPVNVFRTTPEGSESVDGRLAFLLRVQPNAWMTPVEFFEAMTANLVLRGNAYAEISRNATGEPIALVPLPSHQVEVRKSNDGRRVVYTHKSNGRERRIAQERMLHVKGLSDDGLCGLSPIAMHKNAIGLSVSAERYGSKFFKSGGRPTGILEIDKFLTPEQREEVREMVGNQFNDLGENTSVFVAEGGMKYNSVSIAPEDAQFLGTRRFQTVEIARIFRVPPHMIGELERSTFNNSEQQGLEFAVYTLRPYLTRYEQAIRQKLIPELQRRDHFVKFKFEGLLRANTKDRASFYSMMVQNGIMTRNEVRGLEDLNRKEGADELTIQLNLTDVDNLDGDTDGTGTQDVPANGTEG